MTALTAGDRLQIRYDAQTRRYSVMAPGSDWLALYGMASFGPGVYHIPGPMSDLGLVTAQVAPDHADPALRFHYSSLASWLLEGATAGKYLSGTIAFGVPTPPGGVPLTGSASYAGPIEGQASFPIYSRNGFAYWDKAPLAGEVALRFDFAKGALAGEITPRLDCDCGPANIPALAFADTVFAAGSQTYSGRFATPLAGANGFSGLFTGPHAEELIGRWAFPLTYEGAPHAAEGVWAAKRGE